VSTGLFRVKPGAANERLDVYLAAELGRSRAQNQRLLRAGEVVVNGHPGRASYQVQDGDEVTVTEAPAGVMPPVAAPRLPVVYEDADIMVIDKPAGLAVHAGAGTRGAATVADFARAYTSDPDADRPGIVHRLDQDTSGLLIIAKTAAAKAFMQAAFKRHEVQKTYLALVTGRLADDAAVIRLPLGRDAARPLRQAVVAGGRDATTEYHTRAAYPGFTLVEARPKTGRTHQLRVHFAATGHPIAGDTTYGPPTRPLGLRRQFLHASALEFTAPSGEHIELSSPLPADLESVAAALEAEAVAK
jgi:23S rRNA pseudouridine1911/1915/1917 synthase